MDSLRTALAKTSVKDNTMSRQVKQFSRWRLSRICKEIGMIATVVFAMWGPAAAEVLEVRSGDAVLGLDGATGAPVRLADVGAGLELAGGGQELFRLVVIPSGADPQQPLELSSRDAKAVNRIEGDGVRLRFERLGNRNLAAVCVVEAGTDGLFRFRIKVEGESGAIVQRVDYPLLHLAAPLEGDGADDALVLGTTKGGVLERPHRWKPGRSAAGTQPGRLAAQFGCYYGPKGGVVTYCEDDAGYPKTLAAKRTTGGMVLGWRHLMRHDLKESVTLAFPVVAGVFHAPAGAATDWRDAAAIYKAWALKQPWCARRLIERDDLPDWLKQGPAQVRFGREWLGQPERIEAWLEKLLGQALRGCTVDRDLLGLGRSRDVDSAPILSAVSVRGGLETLRRRGEARRRARLLLAIGIPVVPQLTANARTVRSNGKIGRGSNARPSRTR